MKPEQVIRALMKACDELMVEFVSKKRAADWGIINDALVDGGRFLAKQKAKKGVPMRHPAG